MSEAPPTSSSDYPIAQRHASPAPRKWYRPACKFLLRVTSSAAGTALLGGDHRAIVERRKGATLQPLHQRNMVIPVRRG